MTLTRDHLIDLGFALLTVAGGMALLILAAGVQWVIARRRSTASVRGGAMRRGPNDDDENGEE